MAWAQSGEASDLESQIFEQVFKHPTNMLLNFKLAGAQLQNGNVKGAIGTLERVLTIDPENNEAQFLSANTRYMRGLDQGMLAATLNTARIHVGDQHYLSSYGAQFNYSQTFFERWNANTNLGVTRSVFKNSFSSTNSKKTSLKTEASVRVARGFQKFQLGGTFKRANTSAMDDINSKESLGLSAFASANFLPGITTVTYNIDHTDHQAADTNYSNDKRKDRRHTLGVSHVIGLSSFNLPVGNETRISFTANYGKTKSSIANFSKYSGDVALTSTKPF